MANKLPTPELLEKERQVLELKRAGATFDDIARTLGYANSSGAWQAYKRAMKRTLVEAGAEELRDAELDRLDRLQRAVWSNAINGDLSAVNTVLKIMQRRAMYLGLDAPARQEIKIEQIDTNSVDAEITRLVELLAKNDAASQRQQ